MKECQKTMNQASTQGSLFSLTPFFLFIGLFLCSALFFSGTISPLFSCMIAIMWSFFTFTNPTTLNKKAELFVTGSAHPTVLAMCYIFIFSSVFTYVLKLIGGIAAAVNISLHVIPTSLLLPGFFTVVSIFATAIGTSMGAIAAFLPIGVGLAQTLGINPSLMAGIVVGGAMLGDNLSIISDTTIASTQSVGARMTDKFKANFLLVIPAFILTNIVLLYKNLTSLSQFSPIVLEPVTSIELLKTIPYLIIIGLTLYGIDVIAVLIAGILTSSAIGIGLGMFSFAQSTQFILSGLMADSSMIEVLVLALFVAGLAHIVEHNGGISYLLAKCSRHIKNKAQAELSIALLTFIVNAAVAINTIAILIAGPMAKHIGDQFDIPKKRNACLLDIAACVCQGILPYAPQLLLAGSLAGVSSISIIPYLHYQWFMALVLLTSIGRTFYKSS